MEGYPDNNPKSRFGVLKPPLALVPATSTIMEAMAFKDGALKYGPFNWREKGREVSIMVYLNAAKRHIDQYLNREDIDQKSRVHHLGHAKACLGIILDAAYCGQAIDDRPPAAVITRLLDALTEGSVDELGQGEELDVRGDSRNNSYDNAC